MRIVRHLHFKKAYAKRIKNDAKLIERTTLRLKLFQQNSCHPLLRDHALIGSLRGYRAFSVTTDIRIVYYLAEKNLVVLYDIGTHNQVY
jgi:addiction module RelE/StbE family toxin